MRPIDADVLQTEYKARHDGKRLLLIDVAPTIEPMRKKGRWIEQDDTWDGVYYECSECGEPFTLIDGTPADNLYNYCPNCGADMREVDT